MANEVASLKLPQGVAQDVPQVVQEAHIRLYVFAQPTLRLSGDAKHWADKGSGQEKLKAVDVDPTATVIVLVVPVKAPS